MSKSMSKSDRNVAATVKAGLRAGTKAPVHAEAEKPAATVTSGKKIAKGKAAKGAAPAAKKGAAKAPKGPRGGARAKLDPATKITMLTKENPHREDSIQGKRFALAAKSKTVGDWQAAAEKDEGVLFTPYLTHAQAKGWLKLG